jgi:hypothetical protein
MEAFLLFLFLIDCSPSKEGFLIQGSDPWPNMQDETPEVRKKLEAWAQGKRLCGWEAELVLCDWERAREIYRAFRREKVALYNRRHRQRYPERTRVMNKIYQARWRARQRGEEPPVIPASGELEIEMIY